MKVILSDNTTLDVTATAPAVTVSWAAETAAEAGAMLDKITKDNIGTIKFTGDDMEDLTVENTKLTKKFIDCSLDGTSCTAGFSWDYKTDGEILEDKADTVTAALQELPDDSAAKYTELYKDWDSLEEGATLTEGEKYKYVDILYRVIMTHQKQREWNPKDASTLFVAINESNAGTLEDPIPWASGMQPEAGKYYSEDSLIAKCIENPGIPLYNRLSELVPGRYFEKAN